MNYCLLCENFFEEYENTNDIEKSIRNYINNNYNLLNDIYFFQKRIERSKMEDIIKDSEYKNNDDITKVEALESGDIRENIDVEDNINQSSNKLEKECKIILKDKDESIYSLEDFNNEFINKMSDDLIKEIDEINEDSTSNKNETAITKDDFISIKSSELIELLDKMISDD